MASNQFIYKFVTKQSFSISDLKKAMPIWDLNVFSNRYKYAWENK